MSLLSIRREYWREEPDSVEAKIIKCAVFDEIAPIAVYFFADASYEKKAVKALKSLKKHCGHIPEVKEFTVSELKEGNAPFDVGHVYNRLFEMIAEEYGDIAVDKYGAWGLVNDCGDELWGDDSGFFPWYIDEETLREQLLEWSNNCIENKNVEI